MNELDDIVYKIKSVLFGLAVGDALGVPVESESREEIRRHPVTGMAPYERYGFEAGTFSDDSSLSFCLAEALTHDFDLDRIAQNFIRWRYEAYWTANGITFGVGLTTGEAIERLEKGVKPELAGGSSEKENGNGSLMRISPLLFYNMNKPIGERYKITKQVSSITHAHVRSVIACFYYLEFALCLLEGKDKLSAYSSLRTDFAAYLHSLSLDKSEISQFERLLKHDIGEFNENDIQGSGYVLHTLEAAIWSLLVTDSYEAAVLKAVNLGGDADTIGAVTGALAGLLYGLEGIPANWMQQIARRRDIDDLAERMEKKIIQD